MSLRKRTTRSNDVVDVTSEDVPSLLDTLIAEQAAAVKQAGDVSIADFRAALAKAGSSLAGLSEPALRRRLDANAAYRRIRGVLYDPSVKKSVAIWRPIAATKKPARVDKRLARN